LARALACRHPAIASLRLCSSSLVISGISPPPIERNPAVKPAPMLRPDGHAEDLAEDGHDLVPGNVIGGHD